MKGIYFSFKQLIKSIIKYVRFGKIYSRYKEFTMISQQDYLDCIDLVSRYKSVPGAVVECGVWRGGMSAGMADVMGNHRNYYLFDSFQGLPPAKEIDGVDAIKWQEETDAPGYYDNCSADESWATRAMAITGKKNYHLQKGWFEDTIPPFEMNEPIAILRLDGDWYESTMTCLTHFFPKVQPGGLIILDDYYVWDGCSKALHDYLSQHKRSERINRAYIAGCYLVKKD